MAVATPYSLAMRLRSWSAIWLCGTLNLRASRSSSLRPISTARRRLIFVEPVLDLVARAGTFDKRQPVAARLVVLLGDDFDDVAGAQLGAQGRHAAVDLGAYAGVAHFGVDGVGKVNRRAVGRNHHHLPLGREGVDLVGIEVHLQAGEELVGVGHLLLPLDQLRGSSSAAPRRAPSPRLRRPCTSSGRRCLPRRCGASPRCESAPRTGGRWGSSPWCAATDSGWRGAWR